MGIGQEVHPNLRMPLTNQGGHPIGEADIGLRVRISRLRITGTGVYRRALRTTAEPAPIVVPKVNYLYLGVFVEPGVHVLRHQPRYVGVGKADIAAGPIVGMILAVAIRRKPGIKGMSTHLQVQPPLDHLGNQNLPQLFPFPDIWPVGPQVDPIKTVLRHPIDPRQNAFTYVIRAVRLGNRTIGLRIGKVHDLAHRHHRRADRIRKLR
ncbi:MAG: hypothetical protein BWY71_02147 [Planctomycetes bacterium ADurb.Bin412]|nr:MAG: hypothetical protein BWY71_02147 [Planctomycetes bacterium ADurb.Bin412]